MRALRHIVACILAAISGYAFGALILPSLFSF